MTPSATTTSRFSEDELPVLEDDGEQGTPSYLVALGLEEGVRTYATRYEAQRAHDRMEEHALRLAPRVERVEYYTFRVPSEREPGTCYLVDLTKETCTCHYWRAQNQGPEPPLPPLRCKHVIAALIAAFGVMGEEAS